MKITNPGIEATDTHNLNKFLALLYKIDLRNKKQKRTGSEESNKNKEPQIKNWDEKNIE